ncbi:unnamed protein product [Anisakis simplex]|uniref:Myosin_tail_1 domain-containing protein n=1 Tax=Anisakis simplex TaxID=6269 RepID=A0A0M3JBF2_ANISI|nr:unnamed protein product [Anisakis simplex]
MNSTNTRQLNENNELMRRCEELNEQIQTTSTIKAQLIQELDSFKRQTAKELRDKQIFSTQSKSLQMELDQLRSTLDDEVAAKTDLLRQLNKANLEIEQWRSKFEDANLVPSDSLDEAIKKITPRMVELEEAIDSANSRVTALERVRSQMSADADEARKQAERNATIVEQLDKKQKAFDKTIEEWKRKVDDANQELQMAQKESRTLSADLFSEQSINDNFQMQVDGLRRESDTLNQQIHDLQSQLMDGSKNVHEMSSRVKRLETEKDELQRALDEAEAAVEAEETKVSRSQIELNQIRAEIEKRLLQKDEEFDNVRKNHQRAIESAQASEHIHFLSNCFVQLFPLHASTDLHLIIGGSLFCL